MSPFPWGTSGFSFRKRVFVGETTNYTCHSNLKLEIFMGKLLFSCNIVDGLAPYCALLLARAISAILNYAAKCRTRELVLPTSYSDDPAEVSDESVLKFLTAAPSRGKKTRSLEITRPSVSPHFFEKLAEVRFCEVLGWGLYIAENLEMMSKLGCQKLTFLEKTYIFREESCFSKLNLLFCSKKLSLSRM